MATPDWWTIQTLNTGGTSVAFLTEAAAKFLSENGLVSIAL
jgi:hypothetical protein